MGDISEMVWEGILCEDCFCLVYDGDPNNAMPLELAPGYPRKCSECMEADLAKHKRKAKKSKEH